MKKNFKIILIAIVCISAMATIAVASSAFVQASEIENSKTVTLNVNSKNEQEKTEENLSSDVQSNTNLTSSSEEKAVGNESLTPVKVDKYESKTAENVNVGEIQVNRYDAPAQAVESVESSTFQTTELVSEISTSNDALLLMSTNNINETVDGETFVGKSYCFNNNVNIKIIGRSQAGIIVSANIVKVLFLSETSDYNCQFEVSDGTTTLSLSY